MIETLCGCGASFEAPESSANSALRCTSCNKVLRPVAAEQLPPDSGAGDFDAHLVIESGPAFVGDRVLLGGIADIELGKLPTRHVNLPGTRVSRSHCKLVRLDFGPSRWKVVDCNSTNGLFVNGQRVSEHELQEGDLVGIGEFNLRYCSMFAVPASALAAPAQQTGPVCPSCQKSMLLGSKICVACGIYIDTGKPLVTAKGFDEDEFAVRADTWIRVASWISPFGLYPVASEAFGTRKPWATWIIAATTVIVSLCYFVVLVDEDASPAALNLMLWSGSREATESTTGEILLALDSENEAKLVELLTQSGAPPVPQGVQFQYHQLLTHALLHNGLLHLAGNMLFLLVFGTRVNELIGNAKMSILYPLLAIISGIGHMLAERHAPMMPMLGASGAVMGLAGMYLVFFPVQRVRLALWARWFLLFLPLIFWTWIRCSYTIFSMRGFWLLAVWVGLTDIVPVLIGSEDYVAHWAHLGGLIGGVMLALLLLVTRLSNARGSDILSVVLGRRAWALIGKPSQPQLPPPATRAVSLNYE